MVKTFAFHSRGSTELPLDLPQPTEKSLTLYLDCARLFNLITPRLTFVVVKG